MKKYWIAHETKNENCQYNLICFPYPGGSASVFAPWKKYIGDTIGIYPVLYPMREIRRTEQMYDTLEELIENFVQKNQELFEKPFMILGCCAGAVVGYETAIYVEKHLHKKCEGIIAISSEAPCYINEMEQFDFENLNEKIFIESMLKRRIFTEDMIQNEIFINYNLPILKEDYRMIQKYEYNLHKKLDCPIFGIYGRRDESINIKKINDWQDITNGELIIQSYEGNHFFFQNQIEDLCKNIQVGLEESINGCN